MIDLIKSTTATADNRHLSNSSSKLSTGGGGSSSSGGTGNSVGDEDYLLLVNNDLRIAFSRVLLKVAGIIGVDVRLG